VLLTVFTPTYNRRALLSRVYESLRNQTCQEFVWLVVDDGSADDTGTFISQLSEKNKAENLFDIRYIYRENGGKMRAHNTGSMACDTELFLCLDSDDELSEGAVEQILAKWDECGGCADGKKASGIVAYKGEKCSETEAGEKCSETEAGEKCGEIIESVKPFRDALFPAMDVERGWSTLRDLYLDGFYGETTLVFRTELLKQFQFPEIEGEKYVPEDYVYDQIDAVGSLVILPEILTVCEIVEGGYTDQAPRLRRENPTGWFLYYEQRARIQKWSVLKIKYLSHYIRFCQVLGRRSELPLPEFLAGLPGAVALRIAGKT